MGWVEITAALLILLVVRPVTGVLGLIGTRATTSEKLSIAFFGIRGVGSFYYLAYGINHGKFPNGDQLWVILSLVVFASILMHGLTVTPAMRWLDRRHGREVE